MKNAQSNTESFHIPSLDGIRGIAALIVFVAHAGLNVVPGGFGVTIFFFLSGYLITTLLRMEQNKTGSINLRAFYLRRVYRIFPPLYLVLLILTALGLSGFIKHNMNIWAVLGQFSQITNYVLIHYEGIGQTPIVPYTGPMWSLAVEEHFYLVFPLLAATLFLKRSYTQIAPLLFAACLAVLAWRTILIFGIGADPSYAYHATDTRIDSILFGCIMALWWNPVFDEGPIDWSNLRWIGILIIAASLLLSTFYFRSNEFRETVRYTIQGIALFPIFYCAIRFHKWPIFSWLDTKLLRGMGAISYTFYLVHFACIRIIEESTESSAIVTGPLAFVATVSFATASYHILEKPLGKMRRKLHGSRSIPTSAGAHGESHKASR
jgi:peptidoglycan/LPS O-acetylase OafA/YrhL